MIAQESSTSSIEVGDSIRITSVEDDPSILKWIKAFIFRTKRPMVTINTDLIVHSVDNGTTLTISDEAKEG